MSRSQADKDEERLEDITQRLRTMLDEGLHKKTCYELIDIIKEVAVIAVREANRIQE